MSGERAPALPSCWMQPADFMPGVLRPAPGASQPVPPAVLHMVSGGIAPGALRPAGIMPGVSQPAAQGPAGHVAAGGLPVG